jgi:hypothetical protein
MNYQHPPDQARMGAELVRQYKINKVQLLDCSICHR